MVGAARPRVARVEAPRAAERLRHRRCRGKAKGRRAKRVKARGGGAPRASRKADSIMLMSTTSVVDGRPVSRYLGVVTGEAIIGANIFRDMFATVRDIVGGRSGTYEKALAEAREVAMAEMQARAQELGANAVIGIDVDYEVLGQNNGMLMVAVSGTAVVC